MGDAPRPRTVALYGGSFDPPHVCHVLAATWALCHDGVDELRVIPTWQHAFGKPMSPYPIRCEMIAAALAHLGPLVTVDTVERELGGVSYTVRTVEALRERLAADDGVVPRLLWLGGADIWGDRHRWKDWDRLQHWIEPLILGRDGHSPPAGIDVPVNLPEVSSSDIRRRVGAGGVVDHLVGPAVLALIEQHGLYRAAGDRA